MAGWGWVGFCRLKIACMQAGKHATGALQPAIIKVYREEISFVCCSYV